MVFRFPPIHWLRSFVVYSFRVFSKHFLKKNRYFENSQKTLCRESSFLVKLQAKSQNLQFHLKFSFHYSAHILHANECDWINYISFHNWSVAEGGWSENIKVFMNCFKLMKRSKLSRYHRSLQVHHWLKICLKYW